MHAPRWPHDFLDSDLFVLAKPLPQVSDGLERHGRVLSGLARLNAPLRSAPWRFAQPNRITGTGPGPLSCLILKGIPPGATEIHRKRHQVRDINYFLFKCSKFC